MKVSQIDNFFSILSAYFDKTAEIILIGGAASAIMGGIRPTLDVDFEVMLAPDPSDWELFNHAIKKAEDKTGIKAQFAEEVERWSQITWLDYRNHKTIYKEFGSLNVYILDPAYWAIGKIARYWDQDVQDMISVFSKLKLDPREAAELWLEALNKSPRSTTLFLVKKQIIHFFSKHGKKIWGMDFQALELNKLFES